MNERSKLLSYLLRHKPEAKGLRLDKEGWVRTSDLVEKVGFTLTELENILDNDDKGRYSFRDTDGILYMRANQGHSTSQVRLTFDKAVPPVVLYHGTSYDNISRVMKEGLKPMSRHHVHLSAEERTAQDVAGRRKGDITVLKIDAKKMLADGITFYRSENHVWLVDMVDPKYITAQR